MTELLDAKPIPPEQTPRSMWRVPPMASAIRKELEVLYDSKTYQDGRPTESELKRMESAFDAYPNATPLLERAAACNEYATLVDLDDLSRADYSAESGSGSPKSF